VHAQLAVVNGAGRRGHLSREIEQVTFREERERERELLSEREWPSEERERVVSEGGDRDEK
jgi:hypothetical protein